MYKKKVFGYVFLIILSLSFTNALTGFDTLKIINFTATYGFNVTNNMTCSDATWKITDTECNFGRCLRRLKGTTYAYADCRFKDNWANIDPTKTYFIRGWMEDEFVSNNGGYISIGTFNTSSSKVNQIGFHCETPRLFTYVNGTGPNQKNSFTKSPCGDVPIWFEVTLNATSNKIGERICSDQTCGTVLKQNYSVMEYQNFNKNWLAVSAGRDVNFGLIEFYTLSTADTTPPTISNIVRSPSNISIFNLVNGNLYVNATITDNIKVRATPNITFKLNKTQIYINGTLRNYNLTYNARSNVSTKYLFGPFDEHELLSAEYPTLNPGIFENTTHKNITFQGTNELLKVNFLKFRSDAQATLYEEMSVNLTKVPSTTQYFYCNSTYTTGNPSTSNYCTLFSSVQNNFPINHTHGKSFHRTIIIPVNTTSGKINNIKITQNSYIIKKGSNTGEVLYYVNRTGRTNAYMRSSNNGATYSDFTSGSFDIHIHFLTPLVSSINYCINAQDTSNNNAVSCQSDIIDLPQLPPSGISFYQPILDAVYNTTLYINHTEAVSPVSAIITNYTYYYALENSTSFTLLSTQNDHNYNWDISNLANSAYYLKVIVKDSNRQQSTSYSDVFFISNPLTLDTQLLTSINETLSNIYEVLSMLGFIILYLGLMFFAYMVINGGNVVLGSGLMIITLGFDFYLVQYFYNTYVYGNMVETWQGSFIYVFAISLVLWLIMKFMYVFLAVYNKKVKILH